MCWALHRNFEELKEMEVNSLLLVFLEGMERLQKFLIREVEKDGKNKRDM